MVVFTLDACDQLWAAGNLERKFQSKWFTNNDSKGVPGVCVGDDSRHELNDGRRASGEVEPLSEEGKALCEAVQLLRTIGKAHDGIAADQSESKKFGYKLLSERGQRQCFKKTELTRSPLAE